MSSRLVAQETDIAEPFCTLGCPIATSPPIRGVYVPGCPVHDIPTVTGNHLNVTTALGTPTITQTPSSTSLVLVGENPVVETTVLRTPPGTIVLLSNLALSPPATPLWSPVSPRSPANTPARGTTPSPSSTDPLQGPLAALSLLDDDAPPESRLAALSISDNEAQPLRPLAALPDDKAPPALPATDDEAPNPRFEWSLQRLSPEMNDHCRNHP